MAEQSAIMGEPLRGRDTLDGMEGGRHVGSDIWRFLMFCGSQKQGKEKRYDFPCYLGSVQFDFIFLANKLIFSIFWKSLKF